MSILTRWLVKRQVARKERAVRDLIENVYCRLQPSQFGIGVFAIRDIPEGTNPFRCQPPGDEYTEFDENDAKIYIYENDNIPPGVKQCVRDLSSISHDGMLLVPVEFNCSCLRCYINHSLTPNVTTNDGEIFVTTRYIKEGEELFVNYYDYYGRLPWEQKI